MIMQVTLGGKSYQLHDFIQAISDAGFTNGCVVTPNPYFCPGIQLEPGDDRQVPAERCAWSFVYTSCDAEPPHFIDSWTDTLGGDGSWGQPWVEELYVEGLTIGTVNGPAPNFYYSPWGAVTRIQAAKWACSWHMERVTLPLQPRVHWRMSSVQTRMPVISAGALPGRSRPILRI